MGYHSGLNGEYSIPVEVNSKYIKHFRRCCKEEVPEKAIKVETYLKDDAIYFVLPNNYKPVKICFDSAEELRPSAPPQGNIYGGKGNQKLNVDFHSSNPHSSGQGLRPRTPGVDSTGYYYTDNTINISDSTSYATGTSLSPSASETYVSLFDSLLDLSKQVSEFGYSYEDVEKMFDNMFYNK